MRDLLNSIGISDIRQAATQSEALYALGDAPVDAILLANCRSFDAIRLARLIRAASAGQYVPIILIIDDVDGPKALLARAAGVTEFLARPLTQAGLDRCMADIVAGNRAGRHVARPTSAKTDLANAAEAA